MLLSIVQKSFAWLYSHFQISYIPGLLPLLPSRLLSQKLSSVAVTGSPIYNDKINHGTLSPSFTCCSYQHLKSTKYAKSSLLQSVDVAILPMSPLEKIINLQLPTAAGRVSLEMPTTDVSLKNTLINQKTVEIQAPQRGPVIKQLAIRMLVIRRRKMKKHKRRKYLKKFKVLLMTRSKKRDIEKETVFLSGLEEQMKSAELFDASQYASEKIRKAYEPLPQKERLLKPFPWEFQPLYHWSKGNKK